MRTQRPFIKHQATNTALDKRNKNEKVRKNEQISKRKPLNSDRDDCARTHMNIEFKKPKPRAMFRSNNDTLNFDRTTFDLQLHANHIPNGQSICMCVSYSHSTRARSHV